MSARQSRPAGKEKRLLFHHSELDLNVPSATLFSLSCQHRADVGADVVNQARRPSRLFDFRPGPFERTHLQLPVWPE